MNGKHTRYGMRAVVLALFTLLLLATGAPIAAAHSGDQSYVFLEIYGDELEGTVEFPVKDLNEILGLSIPQDEEGATDAVTTNLDLIQRYAAEHFALGNGPATDWEIIFDGFEIVTPFAGTYVVLPFRVDESFDSVPREFTVFYDGVVGSLADRDALLLIEADTATGTYAKEQELLRFTSSNTLQVVSLEDGSWWQSVSGIIGLGVEHIRIGTDHILFIFALVLPSVLVYTGAERWRPTRSFGAGLWRILKIVTMFTIAHSITLALGGLGIVELPAKPVEVVIALSIALAALHNLRPVFQNKEWLLAFGFGLFHGFGFAGLLGDLGLDRANRIESLLGFNIGVEIGQAIIILLVFPALFLLRRTRYFLPFMKFGSVLLALAAVGWAVERLFEVEVGISSFVDPILAWPRSFWLVVIATGAVAAIYLRERAAGRLIALDETVATSDQAGAGSIPV